jgi:AraC family ethanolamine operon transcriptional activator
MPHSSPPTYAFQHTFTDVDQLAAKAKQWNLDFRQLDRGRFIGEILQFATSGVHISEARFCRSLNQKGAPPDGMRTIGIPARRDLSFEWRGKLVDGESLMLFPLGSELSSVSGPDFHVYTCSFPVEFLSGIGETLKLGGIDELSGGADAVRVDTTAVDHVRSCLARICQTMRMNPGGVSDAATAGLLTRELPSQLIATIAAGQGKCPAAAHPKRQTALARAEAYIESNAAHDIRVGDICRAVGVSERTLQYAFIERFGIGPKEFLNIVRLSEVRRQLRDADPRETRVADVANTWGFWHMGQFAADYRRHFQELPSETLRRFKRAN